MAMFQKDNLETLRKEALEIAERLEQVNKEIEKLEKEAMEIAKESGEDLENFGWE